MVQMKEFEEKARSGEREKQSRKKPGRKEVKELVTCQLSHGGKVKQSS